MEKLSQVLTKTNHRAGERLKPDEIVHELKNCMSIVLLNLGSLGSNSDHPRRNKGGTAPLEGIVRKMNWLVEELAELVEARRD
jgi:hypothetical protein